MRTDSPRDAVTISRTFNDATTLIDISTSLPRSPDEPAYLRPSPPYVRSDVKREPTFVIFAGKNNLIRFDRFIQFLPGVSNTPHNNPPSNPPATQAVCG